MIFFLNVTQTEPNCENENHTRKKLQTQPQIGRKIYKQSKLDDTRNKKQL